jgi:hypothetical protein
LDDRKLIGEADMLNERFGKFRLRLFTCILLVSPVLCRAQNQTEQKVPSLRTQSNVVFAPALVKDKTSKLVFGLQAKDFIIEDDGIEQKMTVSNSKSAWTKRRRRNRFHY